MQQEQGAGARAARSTAASTSKQVVDGPMPIPKKWMEHSPAGKQQPTEVPSLDSFVHADVVRALQVNTASKAACKQAMVQPADMRAQHAAAGALVQLQLAKPRAAMADATEQTTPKSVKSMGCSPMTGTRSSSRLHASPMPQPSFMPADEEEQGVLMASGSSDRGEAGPSHAEAGPSHAVLQPRQIVIGKVGVGRQGAAKHARKSAGKYVLKDVHLPVSTPAEHQLFLELYKDHTGRSDTNWKTMVMQWNHRAHADHGLGDELITCKQQHQLQAYAKKLTLGMLHKIQQSNVQQATDKRAAAAAAAPSQPSAQPMVQPSLQQLLGKRARGAENQDPAAASLLPPPKAPATGYGSSKARKRNKQSEAEWVAEKKKVYEHSTNKNLCSHCVVAASQGKISKISFATHNHKQHCEYKDLQQPEKWGNAWHFLYMHRATMESMLPGPN